MTDSAAIYGLVGALGGALLGAGAAITAPFLQHRNEKQTRRLTRDEAELARLIALRSTTRAALTVRSKAVGAMKSGKPLNAVELLSALDSTWADVEQAADAAAADGLYFAMTPTTSGVIPPEEAYYRVRIEGRRMDALYAIGEEIYDAAQRYQQNGMLPSSSINDLTSQVEMLERWRAELLGGLLDRMVVLRNRALSD
ncbi:hypothetical protein [Streptomyces sp. NPDC003710]